MIKLGDRVKDKVTGLQGIVVCRSVWLNGCVRLSVQPEKLKEDGSVPDIPVFDEEQVQLVKASVHPGPETPAKPTGGPRPDPKRAKEPVRR